MKEKNLEVENKVALQQLTQAFPKCKTFYDLVVELLNKADTAFPKDSITRVYELFILGLKNVKPSRRFVKISTVQNQLRDIEDEAESWSDVLNLLVNKWQCCDRIFILNVKRGDNWVVHKPSLFEPLASYDPRCRLNVIYTHQDPETLSLTLGNKIRYIISEKLHSMI